MYEIPEAASGISCFLTIFLLEQVVPPHGGILYSLRMKKKSVKSVKKSKALPSKDTTVAVVDSTHDSASLVVEHGADSLAVAEPVANDSTVLEPRMPTAEELGISITSGSVGSLVVGDTFEFPVTVSWSVNGSAILVVPASSANVKGIMQLGVSQESSRSVKDGKEVAAITFNYKLVAQDTGNLNIPAMRFEIPTQVGTPISMKSESVPVHVDAPFNPLPLVAGAAVGVCVVAAALWRLRRRRALAAKDAAHAAVANDIRDKMLVLKQRVNTADSREWLLELEGICKEYALNRFGAAGCGLADAVNVSSASVNLEGLLKADKLDGWGALLEEFAHARYGGGKRDGFENKETWKAAMRLMGVEEE